MAFEKKTIEARCHY